MWLDCLSSLYILSEREFEPESVQPRASRDSLWPTGETNSVFTETRLCSGAFMITASQKLTEARRVPGIQHSAWHTESGGVPGFLTAKEMQGFVWRT